MAMDYIFTLKMADFLPVFKKDSVPNHHPNLPRNIRAIIVGKAESGKTVLLLKMLLQPKFIDYEKLFLNVKSAKEQPELQLISEAFNNGLSKEIIIGMFSEDIKPNEISKYVNDIAKRVPEKYIIETKLASDKNNIIYPENLDKKFNLIVVDDFMMDKKANEIFSNYYTNGRRKYCGIFYLAQRYNKITPEIRGQVNFVISFIQVKKERDMFYNDVISPFMERDDFIALTNNLWREKHTFIAVNTETGKIFTGNEIFEY